MTVAPKSACLAPVVPCPVTGVPVMAHNLPLKHGAYKTVNDKDGDTAESFAQQNGHTAVAELLKAASPPK